MMRSETYDKIIATIGAHGLRRPCIKVLSEEHPKLVLDSLFCFQGSPTILTSSITRETLLSIYSQHYQVTYLAIAIVRRLSALSEKS